eukprot:12877032-Alexandrium_andersonii.AAC.1
MSASLVGSEMCIRDRPDAAPAPQAEPAEPAPEPGAGSAAPSEPPSAPAMLEGTESSGGQSALAK